MRRLETGRSVVERRSRPLVAAILMSLSLAVSAVPAAAASPITEYQLTTGSAPIGITAGPDGNLWFTEFNRGKIGRITPAGTVTEFAIPTAFSEPAGITAGPDGNLWFAEDGGNKIGRISTSGTIAEYPLPGAPPASPLRFPIGITAGADGNLWFEEHGANNIGKITPTGTVTEYPIPTPFAAGSGGPSEIAPGPGDGNVWFVEGIGNNIARITPTGTVTEFSIPTPGSSPIGITAGPDGNLWFTENSTGKIGRMTPTGTFTEFAIPTPLSTPDGITAGPDGNLWFTESFGNKIGKITASGIIIEFSVPTPAGAPVGIAAGPDGNLWFTEQSGDKIGRISPTAAGPPASLALAPKTQTVAVGTQACVMATVRDGLGTPVPDISVVFSVTGSDTAGGGRTTDSNGQATFCYTVARLPGADLIKAFADTNNNGFQDPGEPSDVAAVTIVLPSSTPGCEVTITNGGWIIASSGDKSTFGGNAKIDGSGNLSGQEQYRDGGPAIPPIDVHAINVLAIVCASNFQSASIFGTATINGTGSYNYRIDVKDLDSLGLPDRYWIALSNGYDSGDQPLGGGDVTIHQSS